MRQPLNEVHFYSESEDERKILVNLSDEILEELNIKKLSVLEDISDYLVGLAIGLCQCFYQAHITTEIGFHG